MDTPLSESSPLLDVDHRLQICDLPADILVLIHSILPGRHIAICGTVCRRFSDIILSNLYLQYKVELAQNGMVDGDSGAPTSERLQQLRKYSSNFRNGIFNHEDLTAHPAYVDRMVDLMLNTAIPFSSQGSSAVLYSRYAVSEHRPYYLSIFIPGSIPASIPSSRWIMPFLVPDELARHILKCSKDSSQDLLVTVEADYPTPEQTWYRSTKVYFYSLNSSKTAHTAHPAAADPCLEVALGGDGAGIGQVKVDQLSISGDLIVLGLGLVHGPTGIRGIEVCNWKTGQVTKRLDFESRAVHFTPLDGEYFVVSDRRGPPQFIQVYSTSPSMPPGPVCILQLPTYWQNPAGERFLSWNLQLHTGDDATTPGGHFRADPSSSMVVLSVVFAGTTTEGDYTSPYYLLIPHATLSAQIRASEERCVPRDHDDDSHNPKPWSQRDRDDAPRKRFIAPWSEWVPQGCLHLRGQRTRGYIQATPFGSRMPLIVFEGPGADISRTSVYVFDVNPLVARHARQVLATRQHAHGEHGLDLVPMGAAIVEDVEAVLPGVVDPECSTIPHVVYRFPLPFSPSEDWQRSRPPIQSVEMNMMGFTVKVGKIRFEERVQTWSV